MELHPVSSIDFYRLIPWRLVSFTCLIDAIIFCNCIPHICLVAPLLVKSSDQVAVLSDRCATLKHRNCISWWICKTINKTEIRPKFCSVASQVQFFVPKILEHWIMITLNNLCWCPRSEHPSKPRLEEHILAIPD